MTMFVYNFSHFGKNIQGDSFESTIHPCSLYKKLKYPNNRDFFHLNELR